LLPDTLAEVEVETPGNTVGNVEAEALLNTVSDTLAVREIETLCDIWEMLEHSGKHSTGGEDIWPQMGRFEGPGTGRHAS